MVVGALLGITVLTACAEPGDNSEIVSGTSATAELTDELAYSGVTLPSDASQLRWLMVNTWDTNDTFVRLSASRSSISRLLNESKIEERSLVPLSKADGYELVLPQEAMSAVSSHAVRPEDLDPWSLLDAEKSTAVAHPMDNTLPSVGAIVLDPAGMQPTVILHWYR